MKETKEKEDGIQDFYRDKTILITGATGFIGMLLIEKILRSSPQTKKIYLIMRDKKGKSMQQRFEKLLDDQVFERMKQACPKYEDKLIPIFGDCEQPNLGLSETDKDLLQEEINIVFHCAATVRFDEVLKKAAIINVRAIRDLLRIARNMKNLQAFVHVSTAYSFCPRMEIGEIIYDTPMDPEKLLNLIDNLKESALDKITPEIIDPWPNTYAFTKAIGENVAVQEGRGLPVCVVRPSMVISTAHEPYPGWTNNFNGPIGATFGAALGLLHTTYLHPDQHADMVPADYVINSIIAAAWHEANRRPQISSQPIDSVHEEPDSNRKASVYNYVSSSQNILTWGEFIEYCKNFTVPSEHVVWIYFLFCCKYAWVNSILRIFLHYFPALLVDVASILLLRKPIMLKAFRKIHKFLDLTNYFHENRWKFHDENVQKLWLSLNTKDKELFPFDIKMIEWKKILYHVLPGLRVYIAKDPLDTIPKGRIKWRRLMICHYALVSALSLLLFRLLWWLATFFM